MTVYNDISLDWEGLSDDDVPSGFTERWDASSDFDIATVDSKKALYNLTAVSNNMYLFSHDAASADADSDDVEVLCKFRVGSVSSYNYVIATRASGTSLSTAYLVVFNSTSLRVYSCVNDSLVLVGSASKTYAANTWYYCRFRTDGTSIKVATSTSGAPVTWDIESTNSTVTGAGWVGPMHRTSGFTGSVHFDYATFATNSDTALEPGASGGVTLTVADCAHAHTADNITLSQAISLVVADALHAHSADNLDLVQQSTLSVQDAQHAHAADNIDMTSGATLGVQSITHGHVADSPALVQANILSVDEVLHGHLTDSVDLTHAHVLQVAGSVHSHAAGSPTLDISVTLVVTDALHTHAVDSPGLIQAHVLQVLDALHAHAADNIGLLTDVTLIVSDALHAVLSDNPSLSIPSSYNIPEHRIIAFHARDRVIAITPEYSLYRRH